MLEIKEVKTKADMRKFVDFPFRLYKGERNYVPSFRSDEIGMLDPAKNPSLADCSVRCWLAYKDGKLAGRVAGIIQ